MKRLAIIGASYLQLPLIEKARFMGYETHVFAWAADDVGEKVADYFYPISIVEKEQILEKCQAIGICGICSIASDLASVTVNYVANAMRLCGNSMECTMKSTNKYLMRQAFQNAGDPSPKCLKVDLYTNLDSLILEYPIIVKPTDRSGSRGIYKVNNKTMLSNAVEKAINESFEKKALIEEFIEGEEYSVEYLTVNGRHHFLALTRKYTTGAPRFVEKGHMEPAKVEDFVLAKIKSVVEKALDTLEIRNGASHSEVKIDDIGRIWIIEIGGRMGGDLIGSHLVYYSTGIDFLESVICVSVGEQPNLQKKCEPMTAGVRFILDDNDIKAYRKIQKEYPGLISLSDVKENEKYSVNNSSDRKGFFLMKGYDRNLIEQIILGKEDFV